MQYATSKSLSVLRLEGVGHAQVGNEYMHLASSLLQNDAVAKCRSFRHKKFGSENSPPFNPDTVKRVFQKAGAYQLF